MKKVLSNRWFILVLRPILGAVFIYAGIVKTQSPQSFADNIAGFQLLPNEVINLLALSLPVFEIIVGVMLIIGLQLRIVSMSVLILSIVFALALGSALTRGLNVDCGCFGDGKPTVFKMWMSLGRDVLLGIAALIIWRLYSFISNPRPVESEALGDASGV